MNNQLNEEDYDKSLVTCDKMMKIIPSIYYGVGLLRSLGQFFERDNRLKEVQELLEVLYTLFIEQEENILTNEEKETYVNQFRGYLILAFTKLKNFLLDIKKQKDFPSKHKNIVLGISKSLTESQQMISKLIE